MNMSVNKANITSEERLLNLIRKQDKSHQGQQKSSLGHGKERSGHSFSDQGGVKSGGLLKFFSGIFIVAIIGLTGLLGYQYLNRPTVGFSPERDGQNQAVQDNVIAVSVPPVLDEQAFEEIQTQIASRDIFEAPWEREDSDGLENDDGQPAGREQQGDLKSLFRVAGIVLDKNDPQVVVEDLQASEIRFLSIGQMVHEAELVEVHEEFAVFIYDKQRVEFRL